MSAPTTPTPPFVVHSSVRGWVTDDSVPGRRRPSATWVAAAGLDDLVEAARSAGLAQDTVELVERRVQRLHDAEGGRTAFSHVDRSPTGDLLLSTPTIWYDEKSFAVNTGTVTLVLCDSMVITAEVGDAGVVDRAVERLVTGAPTPDSGPREVLAALVFTILAQAGEVEISLGEAVATAERLVFARERQDPVERIYHLKREIAEARRAFSPIMAALPEFEAQADDDRKGGKDAWAWLSRVQNTVDRLDRHLVGHDELLGDMLQAHLAQVSVRQNEDMRKISAWAAMITVPTMIAGVYGMNFKHMPGVDGLLGFPVTLVVMAGVCWLLYRAFRRSGWL